MRLSCLVNCDVGFVASSITNQNKFGMCFRVYPNRVISATCSGRLYVGVMMYNGGGILIRKTIKIIDCHLTKFDEKIKHSQSNTNEKSLKTKENVSSVRY